MYRFKLLQNAFGKYQTIFLTHNCSPNFHFSKNLRKHGNQIDDLSLTRPVGRVSNPPASHKIARNSIEPISFQLIRCVFMIAFAKGGIA